jgi:hypothetical protein
LVLNVIIECTRAAHIVLGAMAGTMPRGIVCLSGISHPAATRHFDAATLNMVLENDVVFGTVNANRRQVGFAHGRTP